jgi:M6 family metalloprotease-like protein
MLLLQRSAVVACAFVAAGSIAAPLQDIDNDPFRVLDPQKWENPDHMTWDDYKYPPGASWADPSRKGSIRNFNIALVAVDYPDMDFVVTQAPNSTAFGNPQPRISGLKREDVPTYYRDLLNKAQDLNHQHTLHEYWMEDSAGRFGVDLTSFGPYRLPRKSFQYGVDDEEGGFNENACPESPCSVDLRTDALGAWRKDVGNETASAYELVFILSAGQDESSTWQEFGEMRFQTKEDIPDSFGPPDNSTLPNYAHTRYVEWTSWASASTIWPNAGSGSSTQGESSGAAVYAHELSHLLGIGDNYNNPYGTPARRSYTGPWSMMSRGSFNGPGGPHSRWQIPALEGASQGSHHTVRDKLQLGLTDNSSVIIYSQGDLATSGILVAEVTARSVDEGDDGLKGVRITMDADRSPACNTSTNPLCDGGGYNFYDTEVVDRMGSDSFTPDSGVLISKGKTSDRTQPFQWVIDANPQDINVVDFIRPNGTASMLTVGDYRQLADALFHAGTRSGSSYEHVDEANGLHFYVLNLRRDTTGVLHYTVGARSLEGKPAGKSGVKLSKGKPSSKKAGSKGVTCEFELSNTGKVSGDKKRYFDSAGAGWKVEVPNALATAKYGKKTTVRVAVRADGYGSKDGTVKLTVASESDPSKKATKECRVQRG